MRRPSEPVDALERVFREHGIPFTVQRRAVVDVLRRHEDHPTADMVWEEVVARVPGISRTTVYRSLETLVRLGLATRVGHPGAALRYDPRTDRHHHLVCDRCGATADVESSDLDGLELPDLTPAGFRARDFSVQISGLCVTCAARPPQ